MADMGMSAKEVIETRRRERERERERMIEWHIETEDGEWRREERV